MRLLIILALLCASTLHAQTVRYQLDIDYSDINTEFGSTQGMLVNQQYPAPTLYFDEGDTALVTVNNHMDVYTSVHWHGLLVPPEQDGVPYLSNFPIPPKGSFTYEFKLKHAGTYWYHSHTNLQEQSGLHGGIVVKSKTPRFEVDYEAVLVLQDFIQEKPEQVLANLKKDGDYYALKKDSVVHLWGYVKANNLKAWWDGRLTRMGGMDVSDVGYDGFLINGKHQQNLFEQAKPGEKILLRTINSGTSSYFFWNAHPELDVKVVAVDGVDIKPVKVNEILHAPAETYDFLITLPKQGRYEFRATSQDITGYASVFIGVGEAFNFEGKTKPNIHEVIMSHASHTAHNKKVESEPEMNAHAHHGHVMDAKPKQLTQYQQFKSLQASTLPDGEVREIEMRLTGSMEDYVWTFDDTPLSAADKIKIKRGEVVRIKFINETMMHHPLHLHGHFFRVLVGNGEHEPLKHTVDVKPMETTTIEFFANEYKDWFFHCHNLYHAKTGMARIFSYGDEVDPELMKAKMTSQDIMDVDFYYSGSLKVLDDFGRIEFDYFNIWHRFSLQTSSYDYEFERTEFDYAYKTSRWSSLFIGVEDDELETLGRIGFTYVLPLMLDLKVYATEEGDVEAELETELQLTKRIQGHFEISSEELYHSGLEYRLNEQFSLEAAYTKGVEYSAGIQLRF